MTDFCNDIEPRIDHIIDELEKCYEKSMNMYRDDHLIFINLAKTIEDLRDIRDDIPCDCEVED